MSNNFSLFAGVENTESVTYESGTPAPGSAVRMIFSGTTYEGLVIMDKHHNTHRWWVRRSQKICHLLVSVDAVDGIVLVPWQKCVVTAVRWTATMVPEQKTIGSHRVTNVEEVVNVFCASVSSDPNNFYDESTFDVLPGTDVSFISTVRRGGLGGSRWDTGMFIKLAGKANCTCVIRSAGITMAVPKQFIQKLD
jgi:hypothetical protein